MADFTLLLDAPDRAWAEQVADLMREGLGDQGAVTLTLPGESLADSPAAPGYVVSGLAECAEPQDEILKLLTSKLDGYEVSTVRSATGVTQVVVASAD